MNPTTIKKHRDDDRPIPLKETLAMVNAFIVHTTQFLNRFATECDDKLALANDSIYRLHTTLEIFESKLNSIQGLGQEPPSSQQTTSAPATTTSSSQGIPPPPPPPGSEGIPPPPPIANMNKNPADSQPSTSADQNAPPAEQQNVDPNVPLCKDDPRLAKYFKMVRVGVPVPSVIDKMTREGFDPSVLE